MEARSSAPEHDTPSAVTPGRPQSCTSVCGPEARTSNEVRPDTAPFSCTASTRSSTDPCGRLKCTPGAARSLNRTLNPGCSSAGDSRPKSHMRNGVTPSNCQPPGLSDG